jgi:predicted 3-demethylubiquinone-9 3-methyltransferase (glyoxalase superfamily)
MQKIAPYLWFDDNAEEAVNFYTSAFDNSKINSITRLPEGTPGPEDNVMTAEFQLAGQEFLALNGGPQFAFTPAVSFFVSCDTEAEIDALWQKLSAGGTVLMELEKYPFSAKFGWIQDKFGVSWQLNLASFSQKITTFLMYVGEQHGKAEEAVNLYTSLFEDSRIVTLERYAAGEQDPAGTVKHVSFTLNGQPFMAMDSSWEHQFTFTEAISFFVNCETQAEVDHLWEKLSEGGEQLPCGWLKDRYGVTWQIIPAILGEMLQDKDPERARRVMDAMLKMGKIEIQGLELAYNQAGR